jgi:hypothetical protein
MQNFNEETAKEETIQDAQVLMEGNNWSISFRNKAWGCELRLTISE